MELGRRSPLVAFSLVHGVLPNPGDQTQIQVQACVVLAVRDVAHHLIVNVGERFAPVTLQGGVNSGAGWYGYSAQGQNDGGEIASQLTLTWRIFLL